MACQYDVPPDAALSAICAHDGPVIVDLDETLYLRNSTEDFIDCARPALLALLLLRILDVLGPWRLTGDDTRDNWRVCAISVFFPWTHMRWRRKVPVLARQHINRQLEARLKDRQQPPIILTTGFQHIVTPLVAAMGLAGVSLVAARILPFADRRNGKLQMALRELGGDAVARALVITDSVTDLELLHKCARPLRTLWAEALYRRALSSVYLPAEYISRVKHPGERYILRAIIQEDFALWFLSSIGLALNPVAHLFGLVLLLISFWAIYERGYVDNDYVADRYESDPQLSKTFGRVEVATPALLPWAWALFTGAAAVAILHPDIESFSVKSCIWILVLISTYACFVIYNRMDKKTRVWIYPFLQLARTAGFAVIVPIEAAGAAALGAHIVARWVPYMIYRYYAEQWRSSLMEISRLVIFAVFVLMIVCSSGLSVLLTWPALALLGWITFRARGDLFAIFASARRLDRSASLQRAKYERER